MHIKLLPDPLDDRTKAKMEAFKTAVTSHSSSERPYSANLVEHVDRVMALFDKHFPLEKKSE